LEEVEYHAHVALLESGMFKDFVKRTATSFTERFQRALLEVFVLRDLKQAEEAFFNIFQEAIKLKWLGMMSEYKLKIIWPAIGSSFRSSEMKYQRDLGEDESKLQESYDTDLEQPRVSLAITPGLYGSRREGSSVNYDNFKLFRHGGNTEEEGNWDVMTKAVVLTN
jgi:hypothetical protein